MKAAQDPQDATPSELLTFTPTLPALRNPWVPFKLSSLMGMGPGAPGLGHGECLHVSNSTSLPPTRNQGWALTVALVIVVTGMALILHLHGQVPVHTGDAVHRPWSQQDDTVVTFTAGHRAVLQEPGLIHL